MDTGSSTCFLGEAAGVGRGPGREVLTPAYLRARMPEEYRNAYLANLKTAQDAARDASRNVRAVHWKGLPE